jgi:hypothetical protein
MYMQELKEEMYTEGVTKNKRYQTGERRKANTFGFTKASRYEGFDL